MEYNINTPEGLAVARLHAADQEPWEADSRAAFAQVVKVRATASFAVSRQSISFAHTTRMICTIAHLCSAYLVDREQSCIVTPDGDFNSRYFRAKIRTKTCVATGELLLLGWGSFLAQAGYEAGWAEIDNFAKGYLKLEDPPEYNIRTGFLLPPNTSPHMDR